MWKFQHSSTLLLFFICIELIFRLKLARSRKKKLVEKYLEWHFLGSYVDIMMSVELNEKKITSDYFISVFSVFNTNLICFIAKITHDGQLYKQKLPIKSPTMKLFSFWIQERHKTHRAKIHFLSNRQQIYNWLDQSTWPDCLFVLLRLFNDQCSFQHLFFHLIAVEMDKYQIFKEMRKKLDPETGFFCVQNIYYKSIWRDLIVNFLTLWLILNIIQFDLRTIINLFMLRQFYS